MGKVASVGVEILHIPISRLTFIDILAPSSSQFTPRRSLEAEEIDVSTWPVGRANYVGPSALQTGTCSRSALNVS